MTKWEYATVPLLVHATKQILEHLGRGRLELVQVVPGPNNPEQLVAYLKRGEGVVAGAVESRLAELGLTLPAVVPPLASYQPAVRSGVYVYTSGQLPMVDGKLAVTGKVGAEVTPDEAKELAKTCALNALAAVSRSPATWTGSSAS
ncbi:hypothetical protein SCALM49S_05675 [Streptomyces californicus]